MKFSPQIRDKIKTFIKDKLIEINSYVDDELPEYIVVLSSHRKPRNSLIDDLKLFLGRNTEKFVDWLIGVLEDLEKSILDEENYQNSPNNEQMYDDQLYFSDEESNSPEQIEENSPDLPPRVVINRLNFDQNSPNSSKQMQTEDSPAQSTLPPIHVTFRENLPPTETPDPTDATRLERCKFWPCCKNGDTCPYHHPNKLCRTFPYCKFGDKCIYIHPNCVFDLACTRANCPYTHSGKNVKLVGSQRRKLVRGTRGFSRGISRRIPHSQPKIMCRFGVKCTNRKFCQYSHPVSGKYKWVRTVENEGVGDKTSK